MYNLRMNEISKYKAIKEVIEGYLSAEEASKILGISERQVYRIKSRVEEEGVSGVIHKSRGVKRSRWLSCEVKDKLEDFYKTKYKGFNLSHMIEYVTTQEKMKVSRESLRQILLERGSYIPSKKRPKHRQWREPRAREGQMVQFDTSVHDWLEGRGPKLYLIGGIDDATSSCPGAMFALSDTTIENMRVLKQIVETKGIPLSFYCDRDAKFKTTRHEGLHYNLKGEYEQTQVARALKELGVEIIYANSPQAKGRVERAWGTFQDRLCSEFRLHKITMLEEANRYLKDVFIPKYNAKFARKAKEKGSAYRKRPTGINLSKTEDSLCQPGSSRRLEPTMNAGVSKRWIPDKSLRE